MTIIDSHLHLSPDVSPNAAVAAKRLSIDLQEANITKGVVLHLQSQPWRYEVFADSIAKHANLVGFVNIHPAADDALETLTRAITKFGFVGLKLHPRLQNFDIECANVSKLVKHAGDLNVPVLIDAFPDGDWLIKGFNCLSFAKLAKACPQTRIIIAHFGGHHCLDFMMLAKRIPNMWFDLSYSLLYYGSGPIRENILYCCRSLHFERVLYGSDYPDRPISMVLEQAQLILSLTDFDDCQKAKLLGGNAIALFDSTGPQATIKRSDVANNLN